MASLLFFDPILFCKANISVVFKEWYTNMYNICLYIGPLYNSQPPPWSTGFTRLPPCTSPRCTLGVILQVYNRLFLKIYCKTTAKHGKKRKCLSNLYQKFLND